MSKYDDPADEGVTKSTKGDLHADHAAGRHHKYDPDCDDCRSHAEEEYKRKLANGDLNRIEFVD